MNAIDKLLQESGAASHPAPDHPGVHLLAADGEARRRHGVTAQDIVELAELLILRDGQPVIMETPEQALRGLDLLRSVRPPP